MVFYFLGFFLFLIDFKFFQVGFFQGLYLFHKQLFTEIFFKSGRINQPKTGKKRQIFKAKEPTQRRSQKQQVKANIQNLQPQQTIK